MNISESRSQQAEEEVRQLQEHLKAGNARLLEAARLEEDRSSSEAYPGGSVTGTYVSIYNSMCMCVCMCASVGTYVCMYMYVCKAHNNSVQLQNTYPG